MIHFFKKPVSHIALPAKFTYPFHYTPHPLCVLAAEEVKEYIAGRKEWQEELALGKMFGVLVVVQETEGTMDKAKEKGTDEKSRIGYLAAFSGNLAGKNLHCYFVPPVYDLLQPQGFFKIEEEQISAINIRINELENSPSYLEMKEKREIETEQAQAELNQGKAELKAAKEAREIRRQSPNGISEEEQAILIRESQYQKAEYKRKAGGTFRTVCSKIVHKSFTSPFAFNIRNSPNSFCCKAAERSFRSAFNLSISSLKRLTSVSLSSNRFFQYFSFRLYSAF